MKTAASLSRLIALVLAMSATVAAQVPQSTKRYDVLIKNGHVIDPKNNVNERRDVAVAAGRIAEVARNIDPATATLVIDGSGLYVAPGLIDIHVHVYAGTGGRSYTGDLSVYPDPHSFRACTTTMVDAGSSGWRSLLRRRRPDQGCGAVSGVC